MQNSWSGLVCGMATGCCTRCLSARSPRVTRSTISAETAAACDPTISKPFLRISTTREATPSVRSMHGRAIARKGIHTTRRTLACIEALAVVAPAAGLVAVLADSDSSGRAEPSPGPTRLMRPRTSPQSPQHARRRTSLTTSAQSRTGRRTRRHSPSPAQSPRPSPTRNTRATARRSTSSSTCPSPAQVRQTIRSRCLSR